MVRILANEILIPRLPMIPKSDGTLMDNINEKLDIFLAFLKDLYQSLNTSEEEMIAYFQ